MMFVIMGIKGKKSGGKGTDKLSEALRRAEEAVLRDGKLRDEEDKKKPAGRKPLDMDDVMPTGQEESKPEKTKPPSKPASSQPMVSLDSKKKPKAKKPAAPTFSIPPPAAAKPAAPKKEVAAGGAKKPPPKLGFGMLDLGGGSADSPELELATTEKKDEPVAKPAKKTSEVPTPEPPKSEPPKIRATGRERPPRREPAAEYVPRRSYGRQIKIFLIVLLVLAAIGGGVYGFLRWHESRSAEEAAEKAKIESSSRDSLMDDKFKKEKFK